MSVTFEIESVPTGEYVISLYDWDTSTDSEVTRVVGDYTDARLAVLLASEQSGIETQDYDIHVVTDVDGALSVNLANANFRLVADYLGLDTSDEYVGSEDGEAFLARCLVATVGATSRETVVLSGDGHATQIDVGLSTVEVDVRVEALTALAREAARLGRSVVWS